MSNITCHLFFKYEYFSTNNAILKVTLIDHSFVEIYEK
jgi:hypothetical protein